MNIPNVPHWAIITTSETYVPGDERSRNCPGHGYPEHSITSIHYRSFTDYEEFKAAVANECRYKTSFRAMQVLPVTVEVETKVSIKNEYCT